MRPTLVGYLSVPAEAPANQPAGWVRQLGALAEREGYALTETFRDRRGESTLGYEALIQSLHAGRASAIAVPGLEHLAHIPGLAHCDVRLLSRMIGVPVLVAADW